MIKAYLAGISTQYEGEDIQIQYCIYDEQELISKNSVMLKYQKPAIVGQIAVLTLLNKMRKYKTKEIIIIVNDSSINEIINETTATKNEDVKNMAKKMKKTLSQFANVVIKDVSGDHEELMKWNDILKQE